jgi:hypothetical protein
MPRKTHGELDLKETEADELAQMIADYMEKGFLENIVALFKSDASHYPLVGRLLSDNRFRVKVGTTALMEELYLARPEQVRLAVPSLLLLVGHENPTVRGDAAYLIGLVGDKTDHAALKPLLEDPHPQVAEIAREILETADSSK